MTRFKYSIRYDLNTGLDMLVGSIIKANENLGIKCPLHFSKEGDFTQLLPFRILQEKFRKPSKYIKGLFSLITTENFHSKEVWIERYFPYIPEQLIHSSTIKDLLYLSFSEYLSYNWGTS